MSSSSSSSTGSSSTMPVSPPQISEKAHKVKDKLKLTDAQKRFYKLERVTNFRTICKILATRSSYVLTAADLVDPSIEQEVSYAGQFSEIVHGSINPVAAWRNLDVLMRKDYPLEAHDALKGTTLLACYRGSVSNEQCIVVHDPSKNRVIVSFSGTSNVRQSLLDIYARHSRYRGAKKFMGKAKSDRFRATVHAGFFRIFNGVRSRAVEQINKALQDFPDIEEVLVTGHSMGAAIAYFFALELLVGHTTPPQTTVQLPKSVKLKLVTFGAPRPGNADFATLYREAIRRFREERGRDHFVEYAVKAHNDGVPALPPLSLNFVHASVSFFYLYHGRTYHTPASEREHGIFTVKPHKNTSTTNLDKPDMDTTTENASPNRSIVSEHDIKYPRGGHNYYNGRDMERLSRRMRWLELTASSEGTLSDKWEKHYLRRLEHENRLLEGTEGIFSHLSGHLKLKKMN